MVGLVAADHVENFRFRFPHLEFERCGSLVLDSFGVGNVEGISSVAMVERLEPAQRMVDVGGTLDEQGVLIDPLLLGTKRVGAHLRKQVVSKA